MYIHMNEVTCILFLGLLPIKKTCILFFCTLLIPFFSICYKFVLEFPSVSADPTNVDVLDEAREWCPYKEKFYKKL